SRRAARCNGIDEPRIEAHTSLQRRRGNLRSYVTNPLLTSTVFEPVVRVRSRHPRREHLSAHLGLKPELLNGEPASPREIADDGRARSQWIPSRRARERS